jgi:hypothetical protein
MCFCLLLLTGANFLVYPSTNTVNIAFAHNNDTNDEESPAPVEEKSSSKTGLTIQEEYIHELHAFELSAFIVLSKHKVSAVEKLQVVHFELDAPPPKA